MFGAGRVDCCCCETHATQVGLLNEREVVVMSYPDARTIGDVADGDLLEAVLDRSCSSDLAHAVLGEAYRRRSELDAWEVYARASEFGDWYDWVGVWNSQLLLSKIMGAAMNRMMGWVVVDVAAFDEEPF